MGKIEAFRRMWEAGSPGTMTAIAQALGVSRMTVHRYRNKLGIPPPTKCGPAYRVPEAQRRAYDKVRVILGVQVAREELSNWNAT